MLTGKKKYRKWQFFYARLRFSTSSFFGRSAKYSGAMLLAKQIVGSRLRLPLASLAEGSEAFWCHIFGHTLSGLWACACCSVPCEVCRCCHGSVADSLSPEA